MNECDHYRQLEEAADDGIPSWVDENQHLNDYEHDYIIYCAEKHEIKEYCELRSIGLNDKEAKGAMR